MVQAFMYEFGFEPLLATRRRSTKARMAAIKSFMTDDTQRVLILSAVGNAGLNLHVAKFMIFIVSVFHLIF